MKALAAGAARETAWSRARAGEYATNGEFCLIFSENMEAFYSLALALTADHAKAEQCFAAALDECHKAPGVFRNWAYSWSRLAVIESAIKIVNPKLFVDNVAGVAPAGIHPLARPVLQLAPFERFVYVLTVLDKYSVRDCAILLKCRPQDVSRVQQATLQSIPATLPQLVAQQQPPAGALPVA